MCKTSAVFQKKMFLVSRFSVVFLLIAIIRLYQPKFLSSQPEFKKKFGLEVYPTGRNVELDSTHQLH